MKDFVLSSICLVVFVLQRTQRQIYHFWWCMKAIAKNVNVVASVALYSIAVNPEEQYCM